MKHHTLEPMTGREIRVQRIRDRIHDLLTSSTTLHNQWLLRPPWLRLRSYPHVVEHPSLLDQLRSCAPASTAGAGSSGPASKPAANITALSELQTITAEARRWVQYGLGQQSDGVEADLRLLEQYAPTLEDRDDLADLDWHVTRWWSHARLTTTWDTAPLKVYVHCPDCGTRGGIQLRTDPTTAACFECGASWDSSTIGALGEHVRLMLDAEPVQVQGYDPVIAVRALPEPEVPSVLRGTVPGT